MPTNESVATRSDAHNSVYAELETQLLEYVSDFGVDELTQMLNAAEALRRARRL